jgi:putative spermidine/putrescine transport system ATP-binding protein
MRDGRTEQVAPPDVLYREPRTPFVAAFIGTMNLIEGEVADGTFAHPAIRVPVGIGDGPALLAVRPEALAITPANGTEGRSKVHRVTDYGTHGIVDIEIGKDTRLKAMVEEARDWKAGQPIELAPKHFAVYRDDKAVYRSGAAP